MKITKQKGKTFITFARPCDFHSHVRSPAQVGKKAFAFLVRMNCAYYRVVVLEPNAYLDREKKTHHIETADDIVKYRNLVLGVLPDERRHVPRFLAKLTPKTTPSTVWEVKDAGGIGFKMYPEGVTTGAEHGGVSDFYSDNIICSLKEVRKQNLIFQVHPTMPHSFRLQEEFDFHDTIREYVRLVPGLRIFIEHVSDRRTIALVHSLKQAGARIHMTFTGHHPRLIIDDVLGKVDHHCWPCLKHPEDRDTIMQTMLSGCPYAISITDSAPWKYKFKHLVDDACAGVFNPSEIAIPATAELFWRNNALDKLEDYTSRNGLRAYEMEEDPDDCITLTDEEWDVPKRYDSGSGKVTPFLSGNKLALRISKT